MLRKNWLWISLILVLLLLNMAYMIFRLQDESYTTYRKSSHKPLPVMNKKIIHTDQAPAPIGPYSQAVLLDSTLYISGQVAINPATQQVEATTVAEEAHQVMKNLEAVLRAAGLGFGDVAKTTIFLTDMNDFPVVNEIYGSYFSGDFPARETVQVSALPKNVHVEISMIAGNSK